MGAGDEDSIRSPLVLPRPIYYENMSQITKPFALVHAGEAKLGLLVFMLMDSLVFRHSPSSRAEAESFRVEHMRLTR